MEMLGEYWQFLNDNWSEIFAVVTGLLMIAEVVVKLTPTESDDSALERVGRIWSKVTRLFPSVHK